MRVFLIRHGETVDNVANLYAGSRDSELTNHGVQQATRLGQHFASSAIAFSHIFSSQLKRAVKTAELVHKAQPTVYGEDGEVIGPIVAQVNELAEQDFGSLEGVSFLTRQPGSKVSGKDAHRAVHADDPEFVDVESRESMIRRVDIFLDEHLLPIVRSNADKLTAVAVVSHGITLSVLWRRVLNRMPPRSVSLDPEVMAKYSGLDLERIGGWGNTAYLELDFAHKPVEVVDAIDREKPTVDVVVDNEDTSLAPILQATAPDFDPEGQASNATTANINPAEKLHTFIGCTVTVHAVNSRDHLVGLKRTRGGVGSARHDDKQKSIDTFFKRAKLE